MQLSLNRLRRNKNGPIIAKSTRMKKVVKGVLQLTSQVGRRETKQKGLEGKEGTHNIETEHEDDVATASSGRHWSYPMLGKTKETKIQSHTFIHFFLSTLLEGRNFFDVWLMCERLDSNSCHLYDLWRETLSGPNHRASLSLSCYMRCRTACSFAKMVAIRVSHPQGKP